MRLKRVQFTAYHSLLFPDIENNEEYLDFERVSTGLSTDICAYGFQEQGEPNEHGAYAYKWITRAEYNRAQGRNDANTL